MTRRNRRLAILGLALSLLFLAGLGLSSQYPPCDLPYPSWHTSPYVLPYRAGESYRLYQGNCTLGGHHGAYRYAYDFLMPIGATVTAARAGTIVATLDGYQDGNNSIENWVKVRHADGTIAAYSHLHGLLVNVGDFVEAGDPIGLSGNTGKTGGVPHLHFQLTTCAEPRDCGTLPVTFRNTVANPGPLRGGQVYTALALAP